MATETEAPLEIEKILAHTVPEALKELTMAIRKLDETMQEHKTLNDLLYKDLSAQMRNVSKRLGVTATQQSLEEIRNEMAQDRELAQTRFDTIIAKLG